MTGAFVPALSCMPSSMGDSERRRGRGGEELASRCHATTGDRLIGLPLPSLVT